MKTNYALFICVILLVSVKAEAHDTPPRFNIGKLDSLQKLIDLHKTDDQERVVLLNDYARLCLYNKELLKGLSAVKEARDLSKQLDFKGGKIMYYLNLAAYFGEGPMYTYYTRQAKSLSLSSDKESARYYVDLDKHNYNSGESLDKLIARFSSTLEHFEAAEDKEIRAALLSTMAYFKLLQQKADEYISYNNDAIKLYSELGQPFPVFINSVRKMDALSALGRQEEVKIIETELIAFVARNKESNSIGLITSAMANAFSNQERYALALEYFIKCLEVLDKTDDLEMRVDAYGKMGVIYENMGMQSKASESYRKHLSIVQTMKDSSALYLAYDMMVSPLIALKKYDEARKYMSLALQDTISENKVYLLARYNDAQGQIFRDQERYEEAIVYFKKAFEGFVQNTNFGSRWGAPFMPLYISRCYLKLGRYGEALRYAQQCMELEKKLPTVRTSMNSDVTLLFSEIYERLGNSQKAFEYLKEHQKIRDESDRMDEINRIADFETRALIDKSQAEINDLEKDRVEKEQQNRIQRLWIFSISGALMSALVLALVLYRNNKNKQSANALLSEQKEEIQSTLERLESTQSQLIQSEKMASLGELTAGIAHEIQNPLNFVNNFSELNKELIDEMESEIDSGNLNGIRTIAKDLKTNQEKINHHGKRADTIVKGMLQHSRSSSGIKEPTDINVLADEYLRLAFHGFRAKDKSFNVTTNTDFDKAIGNISIIPQEIGRVILNLINNAYYAVAEKTKQSGNRLAAGEASYQPTVHVSTKKVGDRVAISIKDNGNGIPEKVVDKVFQPFYTTKPTGLGTGLGLSLSYGIVKGHGGDIKLKTVEGEGCEFIVSIPVVS
jgi:two-component system NtrC family sensor kinase